MLKIKLLTLFFAFKNLVSPSIGEKKLSGFHTSPHGYKIEKCGQIPNTIHESSGLEIAIENKTYWTNGDGGTPSTLFEITERGEVVSNYNFPQLKNIDWEEIAKDKEGNLYIGDFGNNYNKRKNLCIYKVYANEKSRVEEIRFSYEDQKEFPPPSDEMNFDCEAMFWHNDSLYLFSKNRGNHWVKMYRLPASAGVWEAKIHQRIYMNSMITAGDISPDGSVVALQSYGRIYFLKAKSHQPFELEPWFTKVFNRSGQSEALVFTNKTDMLVSNEQGKLFKVYKKK